jgi:hypothetical protein
VKPPTISLTTWAAASTASANRTKEYDFWIRGQRQVLPHFCRRHDRGLLIIRCRVQHCIDDLRVNWPPFDRTHGIYPQAHAYVGRVRFSTIDVGQYRGTAQSLNSHPPVGVGHVMLYSRQRGDILVAWSEMADWIGRARIAR